jgi:hypothetical protein
MENNKPDLNKLNAINPIKDIENNKELPKFEVKTSSFTPYFHLGYWLQLIWRF